MFAPITRLVFVMVVFMPIHACTSKDKEAAVNEKTITSIESINENITIHFADHSARSFSLRELEVLLKKKEISAKTYQEALQKAKDKKRTSEQHPIAKNSQTEKPETFSLNGMKATSVEYKREKFIFHLADKTTKAFTQEEIDCLWFLSIISPETFLLCSKRRLEEEMSHPEKSFSFSFSAREIDCNSCN